jgi:hypothetical protein
MPHRAAARDEFPRRRISERANTADRQHLFALSYLMIGIRETEVESNDRRADNKAVL